MANAMKARMNALMAQEIERNPNILLGKKTIGYALIVWLASRLVFHAADFACVAQGFWELSTTNLIGLVAGVVFALSAYAGAKLFAILPMIGGFMLLYESFTSGCFEVLLSDEYYTLIRVYAGACIMAAVVQIIVFLFIALNGKTKAYFDAFARVNTAVINEGKSL